MGRDARSPPRQRPSRRFNPRARVGRDKVGSLIRSASPLFQSTRPRGARPRDCLPGSAGTPFQSTRPRGARRHATYGDDHPAAGFNPRARVGRDLEWFIRAESRTGVSIHAPAWGATSVTMSSNRRVFGFNPRARVGRDPNGWWHTARLPCFNPRARVGRDNVSSCCAPVIALFQSTRPRGARRYRLRNRLRHRHVSIHAPAWGATPRAPFCAFWTRCFNPRARVGRDAVLKAWETTSQVSIHAPAWGAT